MPALVAGANAANRDLIYIGISGDGDSLSIGLGHLCHAIRRNVNVLYVLENNGVYGLTKGQFSASADPGSLSKKGEENTMEAIDGCLLALTLGATFVARGFSGDKDQLVPILKAGLKHNGLAFVDVISPCVTFNDHEGSTKSYAYTREKNVEVVQADFVPPAAAITTEYERRRGAQRHAPRWQLGAPAKSRRRLRPERSRSRVQLHPRARQARRNRDRPAVPLARFDRHARAQQHDHDAARPASVRPALPGQRASSRSCRRNSDSDVDGRSSIVPHARIPHPDYPSHGRKELE